MCEHTLLIVGERNEHEGHGCGMPQTWPSETRMNETELQSLADKLRDDERAILLAP